MKKDNRTNILFRYGLIVALILLLSQLIVGKLIDTTILSAPQWNRKANEELSRTEVINPERGNILASNGSVLAANLRFYTVRIDYRCERFMEQLYRDSLPAIADSLAKYFPRRDAAEWRAYLSREIEKPQDKRSRCFPLLTNINYADLQRLRTFPFFNKKNPNRNGLVVEDYMRRVNPYGNMARRSIGGVGQTVENSEVHGISGIESALDSLLYGKPGVAKRIPVTSDYINWTDIPAVPGYDIQTTIDINLQDVVENELNRVLEWVDADWGVAVLMEVSTGNICAISNLEKSPRGPGYIEGMNRAVQGFEPGSVVKTISMLIALEDGIVRNVNEYIPTGRSWAYAGGRPITDSHAYDGMTVAEVIERSSNIGMARIITRRYDSNPGGFYSRLKQMGFLEPMNTGIKGERPPRIDSVPNDRGGRIALSRMAYGYATEIPPLYTLSVYNAIANKGRYVRPRLVSRLIGQGVDSVLPVTYIRDRICSEENADKLRDMLTNVVYGPHGTARRFLQSDLVKIAGKTGTCYIIENGQYNTSMKRLSFCGFFPADNPKYSCIVLVSHPRRNALSAPSTSGMVLKNIALKLYARGRLGDHADYTADAPEHPTLPLYHASVSAGRNAGLHSSLAIGGRFRSTRRPASPGGNGVIPDVTGLSAQDAVALLETSGYNVSLRGAGNVRHQEPAGGTRASAGRRVTLTLQI